MTSKAFCTHGLIFTGLAMILVTAPGCLLRAPYTRGLSELTRAQAVADLDYLCRQVGAIHPDEQAAADGSALTECIGAAKASLPETVGREALRLVVAEALATLDDAHTRSNLLGSYFAFTRSGQPAFPLLLRAQRGGLVIKDVAEGVNVEHVRPGALLRGVGNQSLDQLITSLGRYISAETDSKRLVELELLLPALLWYQGGPAESFELRVRGPDGTEHDVVVPAAPYRFPSLTSGTSTAAANQTFRFAFFEDAAACLLRIPTFDAGQREAFRATLNEMFAALAQHDTQLLIVDVRRNSGGSTALAYDLLRRVAQKPIRSGQKRWRYSEAYRVAQKVSGMHQRQVSSIWLLDALLPLQWFRPIDRSQYEIDGEWLTSRPTTLQPQADAWPGRLVVLTDRWTASAAVDLAVLVQDNELGLIVGEETGGLASYYGEVAPLLLPNSGITAQVSSAHWTRPSGVDNGRGVLPDIAVDPELSDKAIVTQIRSAGTVVRLE